MTRRVNGKEEVGVYIPELDRRFMSPQHCASVLKVAVASVYRVLRGERPSLKGFTVQWEVPDTPEEGK